MRLYTICVNNLPILVMSAGVRPPMNDSFTTDPKLMKALPDVHKVVANNKIGDDLLEIEEALDRWLGNDLQTLGLWNGNAGQLCVRQSRIEEAAKWHSSRQHAINTAVLDVGHAGWITFLHSVSEGDEC